MGLSLRNLGRKITDIFDANSASDIQKRVSAGQPAMYADQQRAIGNMHPAQNIVGAARNIAVEGFIKPAVRTSMAYSQAFGNLGTIAGGGQSKNANQFYNKNLIDATGYTGTKQQVAADLVTNVLNFGVPGTSKVAVGATSKILPKTAPKIISQSVGTGVAGAIYGGPASVATLASNDKPLNKTDVLNAYKSGTIYGGITGAVIPGAYKVGSSATKPIVRSAKDIYSATPLIPSEIGAVGKNVNEPKLGSSTLHNIQEQQAKRYDVSAVDKAKNKVLESVYDPRAVEQKLDNAHFKMLKNEGQIAPGQSELLPNDSLAITRGKILNPYQPAAVRDKAKYTTPIGDFSVDDLIREYGDDNSPKAKDFEVYRIYKDELERLANGETPTIPITSQEMSGYIKQYEVTNPDAIYHNAALRQHYLNIATDLEKAGTEAVGTTEKLAKFQHYTQRKMQSPEDMVRMQISGGIKGGQKGVQGRTQFNEAPTAPLSLAKQASVNAERDLANQRYGQILVDRIKSGTLPGGNIAVKAEDVAMRKELLATAKSLLDDNKKASVKLANTRADLRAANILKGGAETSAIKKAKEILLKNVDSEDAKAAVASLSKKDLLDIFETMMYEGTPNIKRIESSLYKRSGISASLLDEINLLKKQIEADKEIAQALKSEGYDLNNKIPRYTESVPYRADGSIGKIDLPAELAQGISKQNEINFEKTIGKSLRGFSNIQKAFWTGILQPSFKVYNTLAKNPTLMFVTADGLSGVRPAVLGSFARQLARTENMQLFKKEMMKRGMAYENAWQSKNIQQEVAKDIAERANLYTFVFRNPIRTLRDVWRGMGAAFATVDNAQRYAVATGAYKRALGLGFSENQALDIASQASAKVFGDFNRITQLAQAMEPLMPYTGATQAGQRALIRSFKTRPAETAVKVTALGAGITGLAYYSIQNANEYYNDMISQKKEYQLDNNLTIALPGAHKDDKGNWQGIVTIPLLPDIRPMNRAVWREVHKVANGSDIDPAIIASEAFNQVTGDARNQLYDSSRAQQGGPAMGVLPSSPLVTFGKTMANVNTYNGGPLADEYMQNKPRTEQATDKTSEGAKNVSNLTKGILTPLQVDQLAGSGGTAGDILQSPKEAGSIIAKSLIKPLKPGKSLSEKQKSGSDFYKDVADISKSLENKDDFRVFQALTSKNSEKKNDDSSAKAKELLARPSVLSAMQQLDQRKRSRGENGDPFFDLSPEQQQKVLRYRGAKDLNSAKQAYDKNGVPLFIALGLDEPWYDNFKDKEDAFYKSVGGKTDNASITYSGKPKPKDSPEVESLKNEYYALPKGTGARSAFIKAHPEILQSWAEANQFTNEERIALGLKPVEDNAQQSGSSGKYYARGGYGKRDSSGSTKNPYKYAVSIKSKSFAKPTVKKGKSVQLASKSKPSQKPKVSIKKSLV